MMRYRLTLLMLFVAAPLWAGGDDGPDEFWFNIPRTAAASATQIAGVADPWTASALRVAGFDHDLWYEPPLTLDRVPPLNPRRLAAVGDDDSFENDARKQQPGVRDEDALFWQAVLYTAKVPGDVFAKAALNNRHLTYGHLYTEPAKYRGQVVHFSGRLVKLKQLDPPADVRARGVNALYEGWIFLDQPGIHPLCVVVPQVPSGLSIGDDLNVRVDVDGYFFKRYGYISGRLNDDGDNIPLKTVLLIAPTVVRKTTSSANVLLSGGNSLFGWIIGFGFAVVVFMVALTWWFRRNDRLVQARLESIGAGRFAEQAAALEKTLESPSRSRGGAE
jgi:hypothetical protein